MGTEEMLVKYDPEGLHKVYDRWPEIARESYESNHEHIDESNVNHIIFAGMGGSGSVGDLFSSIFSKTNLFVSVVKGYNLPKNIDKNTLVITTSVSGNTVETLNILQNAFESKCRVAAFSSGGKMEEYCKKHNILYKKLKQNHSPRASFPTYVYSLLKNLEPLIPLTKTDIFDSIKSLEKTKTNIFSSNLTTTNNSLNLAKWISSIPLIYYPWGLQTAAIRFKNSLQENAKMHTITEDVVEACHNGIVAWENPSEIKPILIRGVDDYSKTKETWQIIKQYFKNNEIDFYEIISEHGNILSKLISLVYVLDYASIYKAVISHIDPSPVLPINYVKEQRSVTREQIAQN
ncbi:glucose-mannose-6-phosphate isomerase protein [Marine Group I thaumarchaeote SCGC AAA799-B03]|uniref:Glucose-mannose-6-phosphate isomerase protein n=1 Tax=Marine Group I thaumarchaeote SCGC AAA799-B03 TaxID=1502289 RepID=A0A087S931_9ARCH|nr:glucose-mannose-6-phosphate isomerase protein [Marine Group I thaumarchaeote SCGC AAA799-B03]